MGREGAPRKRSTKSRREADTMRSEYDFDYSTAVRGMNYRRLKKEGSNAVLLDPDIAKRFRSSEAVNDALRSVLKLSKLVRQLTTRRRSPRM